MLQKNRWLALLVLMSTISVVFFASSPLATAQDAESTVRDAMVEKMTINEILEISGWPMYVLIVVSFVASALVIYFLIVKTIHTVRSSRCAL